MILHIEYSLQYIMLPLLILFLERKKDSIQFWKDRKSDMIFKTDVHDAH